MEYTLENKYLSVKFQPLGGALSSIKDKEDGTEYLWQGNKEYWSGQAPVLFPICGSIREDMAYTKDGKKLCMPRHGIVRKRNFEAVRYTEDDIVFEIKSDDEMLKMYPYPFRLAIRYQLYEKTIRIEYIVTNQGREVMPFQIGAHPGFNCPLSETEKFEDYKVVFSEKETCNVPEPVTETGLINISRRTIFLNDQKELELSHEMFRKDAVILDQIRSRSVTLCSKNAQKGVEIERGDFPYLILWSSSNDGPFLAIEPWEGLSTCDDESDIFEEKRNMQFAAPEECKKYVYHIRIL